MFSIWDENYTITGAEKEMLRLANIPECQHVESTLFPDACDTEAWEQLTQIRNNLDRFMSSSKNNLVICGKNLGCGKTEWALKMMLTYIENNKHRFDFADISEIERANVAVFCLTVPFLVDIKQFNHNEKAYEMKDRLKTAELVVFDDIAALPMSNYDYSNMYSVVEDRLWNGLPTIYTTNIVSQEDLEKEIGPRLAERIWKTSKVIELRGRGYRGI